MPLFTIESTYRQPVYRHRTYEAANLTDACRLAIEDDDWEGAKRDNEATGGTYVTGAWEEADSAYRSRSLRVPSHFDETVQRKADHFEVLLGLVKVLSGVDDAKRSAYWARRAASAAAKAEAIPAGARDPDPDAAAARPYVLLLFDEREVRSTIGEIIAHDGVLTTLPADAIDDDDIHAACVEVAAAADLSEEKGLALFKAAITAIRSAERRQPEKNEERERRKEE
ncbi:hypothetical protein HF263_30355 [Rhizobium leguminosarum]|uniref:hypothetical protein n=1 Tax=Rhizobium leguminosarum TaxID=384 RepID=UPI001C90D8A6|nr:hypothetical protein [Rhizobium leguminosarum]MBY3060311.1 hypothetical protein [Rhizobium leguminosarum]